jgi:hypothetical protein
MFQSIGSSLEGKQKIFERDVDIRRRAQSVMKKFLKENHPKAVVMATYRDDIRTMSLTTPKQSVLNELLLHTKDIRACLRAANIPIATIAVLLTPNS